MPWVGLDSAVLERLDLVVQPPEFGYMFGGRFLEVIARAVENLLAARLASGDLFVDTGAL